MIQLLALSSIFFQTQGEVLQSLSNRRAEFAAVGRLIPNLGGDTSVEAMATKSRDTGAKALSTTVSTETGLANIVAEINKNKSLLKSGSNYRVLSVSKMSESDFKVHYKTRINGNRAIVLHPELHKTFFGYLNYSHGYTNTHVKFIEVYNEVDFIGKESKGEPKGMNRADCRTIAWKKALELTTLGTTTALHTIGY